MIYRVMVFLLLCGSLCADRACLVGGSSSAAGNAGWYNPAIRTASEVHGGNGAYLYTEEGATVGDDGSGNVEIFITGAVSDSWLGLFGKCAGFNGSEAGGTYEITETDEDSDSFVITLSWIDSTSADIMVGGAIALTQVNLQAVLDSSIGSASAQNVDIRVTGNLSVTANGDNAGLTIDSNGGAALYRKRLLACDSSYVYSSRGVTITATGSISAGMIYFAGDVKFVEIRGFVLDCAGPGNALRGIYEETGDQNETDILIYDCEIDDADGDAMIFVSPNWAIIDCDIHDSDGRAVRPPTPQAANLAVMGCRIYSNLIAIDIAGANTYIVNNVVYDNTARAISHFAAGDNAVIINNTFDSNVIGILTIGSVTSRAAVVANNIFSNHTGFALDWNSQPLPRFIDYNLFYNNNSGGDDTDIVTDANINDGTIGYNNLVGTDPSYVNAGAKDFTLNIDSVAIDAGLFGIDMGSGLRASGGYIPPFLEGEI